MTARRTKRWPPISPTGGAARVGQENTRNELAAARRQREASFAAKQDRVAAYGKAGRHPHAAKQGVNPLMGFILFLYENVL